jgi:hypothetical protein
MPAPSAQEAPSKLKSTAKSTPWRQRLTHAWGAGTQTISALLFLALFGVFIY